MIDQRRRRRGATAKMQINFGYLEGLELNYYKKLKKKKKEESVFIEVSSLNWIKRELKPASYAY